jgi:hypothetical protein
MGNFFGWVFKIIFGTKEAEGYEVNLIKENFLGEGNHSKVYKITRRRDKKI